MKTARRVPTTGAQAPYDFATFLSGSASSGTGMPFSVTNFDVRVDVLRRDADDGRVERGHVLGPLRVRAELLRADRREVARVEEQDHPLAAMVGEAEAPLRPIELELGSLVSDLQTHYVNMPPNWPPVTLMTWPWM